MATVVIIPGSFVFGKLYKTQVDSLAKQGISTAVVDLPSVGPRAQGPATMSGDVDEIVRVVEPLLDQGKDVVLFTHSYGGIPTTESLKVLSSKSRAANGKTGGVNSVVYLASIILSPGTSNWDLFEDKLNEFVAIEVSAADSTLKTSAGDDKVTVHKIDSGHAPVISRPDEVTAVIKQAVSA